MQAAEAEDGAATTRRLRPAELADLCAGLFGVQVVWGLQNVNTSRIFQTLGADVAQLPLLWIAAPITGLLIQPLVGYWSDRYRGRFGRRKPFIVVGTLATALAMLAMAHAATLTGAVVALWLLTAAINVAMQPFRSLAADRIPPGQRTSGFALQVCFIGAGAVFASALPWMLVNWAGVNGTAPAGMLPRSIRLAFEIAAMVLLLFVGWTVLRTRDVIVTDTIAPLVSFDVAVPRLPTSTRSFGWLCAGAALVAAAALMDLRRETYLLAAMLIGYGLVRLEVDRRYRRSRPVAGPLAIGADIVLMPQAMRQLALTQFLTWFALFTMWVYAVPAIAARQFGTIDPASPLYAKAGDWVGVLFAAYDGVAVIAALSLPALTRRWGLRGSHAACLAIAGIGLAGFLVIDRPIWLLMPAIAVGVGWASILATPYVIVATVAPPAKTGVFMGIHNMFLVLPQLVAAASLGAVLDHLLAGRPGSMLAIAAGAMLLAALSTLALPTHLETDAS